MNKSTYEPTKYSGVFSRTDNNEKINSISCTLLVAGAADRSLNACEEQKPAGVPMAAEEGEK